VVGTHVSHYRIINRIGEGGITAACIGGTMCERKRTSALEVAPSVLFRRCGSCVARIVLVLVAVLQIGSRIGTQPLGPRLASFGFSVALRPDTVFVGATETTAGKRSAGTVHMFERRPTGWVRAGVLSVPAAIVKDPFGVSMSAEGDTLVVGAQFADDRGTDAGMAYVFDRVDGRWQQTGILFASDGSAGDQFGLTVSVSGDTIAIGARLAKTHGPGAGAAYVFTRNGRRWDEVQKLVASDAAAGDLFGRVSLDKDVLLVSADLNDDQGANAGKVYCFRKRDGRWVEDAKILANDGMSGDEFGVTLALQNGLAVFGALGARTRSQPSGAAYAFDLRNGGWAQIVRLAASDAHAGQGFGSAVAAGADTIAVGAPDMGSRTSGMGAVYIFDRQGDMWTQSTKLTAGDAARHMGFGSTVALAGDLLVVGNLFEGEPGATGAAYVFERRNRAWSQVARLAPE
jgi:hypothetical protein